jgi:hypothetical protein
MAQYLILISDLDDTKDRIVSNHDIKDVARERCRKLNAQIIAERGMPEKGKPPVPLYYVLKVGNWNGGLYRRFLAEKQKSICVVCGDDFSKRGTSLTCGKPCSYALRASKRSPARPKSGEIPGRYAL